MRVANGNLMLRLRKAVGAYFIGYIEIENHRYPCDSLFMWIKKEFLQLLLPIVSTKNLTKYG
jgi:hypothetical protein